MRDLTSLHDIAEAHFLRSLLEAEGIPAVVAGEQIFPFMGTGLTVRLLNDEDYDRAMVVMRRSRMGLEGGG